MKKLTAVFLAMLLLALPILSCAETAVQPRYNYISQPFVGLQISGGVAQYYGGASAVTTDTTTHITVSLVRKADDSNFWLPFESWTATSSGQSTAIISKSPSVDSGYTYYAYTYVEIKDSNGNVLETTGVRSSLVHY